MSVEEHTIELAGSPVYFRRAPASAPDTAHAAAGATAHAPTEPLYLHGVPTSSDDWTGFLERGAGVAPDLIGFGRSGKGGHLDYSPEGIATFVGHFLDTLEIARVHLVAHQWAALSGLVFARRNPNRVQRIVLIDPIPPLEQFRWPGFVRAWRRPLAGELLMGATTKRLLARALRRGGRWPDYRIDALWEQFDQGTQRAILRLARATGEQWLATARACSSRVENPILIIWGERDPWLPATLGDECTRLFGNARLERIRSAGHWPWLEDPSVPDLVAAFLQQPNSQP